jgi:serine/threonine-protein kinase
MTALWKEAPATPAPSPAQSLAEGEKLPDLSHLATPLYGSRYEILSLIGVGGSGNVYRAKDVELGEIVALKVLRQELLHDAATVDRFRNEVRLARRVTHRNVARMFDIEISQPKKPKFSPTSDGGRMPPPGDLNHARRAPTCGRGITTGSRM